MELNLLQIISTLMGVATNPLYNYGNGMLTRANKLGTLQKWPKINGPEAANEGEKDSQVNMGRVVK